MLWKLRLRTARQVDEVILKAPDLERARQVADQYVGKHMGQKFISLQALIVAEWTPTTPTPDPPLTTPSTAQDTGISPPKDLPGAGGSSSGGIRPIKGT